MKLRSVLARVLVLGVGATQAGCCCFDAEYPEDTVEITQPTPEIAALIAGCGTDADACRKLCAEALEVYIRYAEAVVLDCEVTPLALGARVHVVYDPQIACGRAPAGLVASDRTAACSEVAAWLARAAHLEAASIVAFVHLATDLAHLGAPRVLIHAALAAAADEVRHARVLRALAGVEVPVARVAAYQPASLRALAIENAAEGCVRETLGAAVNLWQAQHARDPVIRAAFARIAEDEVRHAALSWQIHAWAMARLAPADAADVTAARRHALASFAGEDIDAASRAALGLPDRAQLSNIVATMIS